MYPHNLISPGETSKWQRPDTHKLIFDFTLNYSQLILPYIAIALWPTWFTYVASFILIGGAIAGLELIVHEFVHNLVVPHNRRLNDFLGRWLFAAPVTLPYDLYRFRHFDHHRFVSTEQDTKQLYRRNLNGFHFFYEFLKSLSGYDYVWQVIQVLLRRAQDQGKTSKGSWSDISQLLPIFVVQMIIFFIFLIWNPWYYLWFWILPRMTITMLFSKIRSSVEHQPFFHETEQDPLSPYFQKTRTVIARTVHANFFERIFFSKINFHFHREHHIWPGISYQYLPLASKRLSTHRVPQEMHGGYLSTLWKLIHRT